MDTINGISHGDFLSSLMLETNSNNRTTDVLNAVNRNLIVQQFTAQIQTLANNQAERMADLRATVNQNALNAKLDSLTTTIAQCCCDNKVSNAVQLSKLDEIIKNMK